MTIVVSGTDASEATITGIVVDERGKPRAEVLVRAIPMEKPGTPPVPRPSAFAVTGEDGAFTLADVDTGGYLVSARTSDGAPVDTEPVNGGARDVRVVLAEGLHIRGTVSADDGSAISAYTLLAMRRKGAAREVVQARTIVDATGAFSVELPAGSYDLVASAQGWAPSAPTVATTGDADVRITVSAGASVFGRVTSAVDGAPLPYVRITREATGGGASVLPSNVGVVTAADGTFRLSGLPLGPITLIVAGGGHHPKVESGLVATAGASLGPLQFSLRPLGENEVPTLELVGIGCKMRPVDTGLFVEGVIAGGGAEKAGVQAGDIVTAVDGVSTLELGLDIAIARIRGAAGTFVKLRLARGDASHDLTVERRPIRA